MNRSGATLRLFLVLSLLAGLLPGALAPAQTPSPEQLQQLSNLSPEEREALLLSMGQAPETASGEQRDTSTPLVILPRPDAVMLAPLEAPPESLLEMLPEPEDSIYQAFMDFLAEPGEALDLDLVPFGYDLFAGAPSTFAPATDIPVGPGYLIGPGDEIHIRLYGRDNQSASPIVDRDGLIDFPGLGPLSVAGLSFSELREMLAREVEERMGGTELSLTMGRLRSMRIFVLGEVYRPGAYTVSSLSSLSHALYVCGGVQEIGSLRRVQHKRQGELVGELDLYDLLLDGDSSGDRRLMPGDVLFVPPVGPRVGVAGEVRRPALYEIREGLDAAGIIELAGGMTARADDGHLQLERIADGKRQAFDLSLSEAAGWPLLDGDLLKIFPVPEERGDVVYLEGNVLRPGMRQWSEGLTVGGLIGSLDELLPETYLDYGLIQRESALTREPEFHGFSLRSIFIARHPGADPELRPRDRVYLFHLGHFRPRQIVVVDGEVRLPGEYEFRRGMRALDLLLAAGGLTRDAWTGRAELLRVEPGSQSVSQLALDLDGVLAALPEHNVRLQDMDTLRVHSLHEFRQPRYVEVLGEVHNPGKYPLFDGMRISDLVFAGGNPTERAYLQVAELTRFDVVNGERRELWRLAVPLERILHGDLEEDIELQPYDNLLIRRISNWRSAERVKVTGEVAFPGTYPVENGEKLSDLIERFGGFLSDAYLPGAVFTRETVREIQEAQFERMREQLQADLTRQRRIDSTKEGAAGGLSEAVAAGEDLVKELEEAQAVGRLVIRLEEVDELRGSEYDLQLQHGDHLHVPKLNDFIMVMGQVHNPMAFKYRPGWKTQKYINQAGGKTRFADGRRTYVVRADGSVAPKGDDIQPGDVIVVPESLETFSTMEFAADLTQILYQLSLAAAAAHTIGLFD